VQTVVYSFSKSTVECENILTSTLFARDFATGNSVLQPREAAAQSWRASATSAPSPVRR
jgi:hypothetical protein